MRRQRGSHICCVDLLILDQVACEEDRAFSRDLLKQAGRGCDRVAVGG
jgi:hypothetical protein